MARPSTRDRFSCQQPDCGRKFRKAEHLVRHERRHSGAKPFNCPLCQRRFARNDSMIRHSRLHENFQPTTSSPMTTPKGMNQHHGFGPLHPAQQSDGFQRSDHPHLTVDMPLGTGTQELELHPFAGVAPQQPRECFTSTGSITGTEVRPFSGEQQDFGYLEFQNALGDCNVGFDWSFTTEDFFNLLRADSAMPPLTVPFVQYSPETQAAIGHDPVAGSNAIPDNEVGSVDASRQAVSSMNKIIRDLPARLVAELEGGDKGSSFFDDCLDLFFTQFSSALPLLHKPTFVTRDCGSTVLLNMLALGSLFVGTKDASSLGESLWSLAHAVVATSWQSLISQRGPRDDCDGVQLVLTAALGQTYAMLSKNSKFRMTSQIFHGLGFYWSRHCRMYDASNFFQHELPALGADYSQKTEAWRAWAASETRLRAILGHYILDAQIAHISGNPTCVRHATNPLPLPASTAAFDAISPDSWILEMNKSRIHDLTFRGFISALFRQDSTISTRLISALSIRVILECLQSLALEAAQAGGEAIGILSQREITAALLHLYRWQICQSPDRAELCLRWHAVFLSITMDVGVFCNQLSSGCDIRAASPPQPPPPSLFQPAMQSQSRHVDANEIHAWVKENINARRALLHAFAIRDITQSLPYKHAHAIHIPSTIFLAATVHAAHMLGGVQRVAVPDVVDWDTVWTSKRADAFTSPQSTLQTTSEGAGAGPGTVDTRAFLDRRFSGRNPRILARKMPSELHALRMQLKAMASPWGIAQEMDKVMEHWREKLR